MSIGGPNDSLPSLVATRSGFCPGVGGGIGGSAGMGEERACGLEGGIRPQRRMASFLVGPLEQMQRMLRRVTHRACLSMVVVAQFL